MRKSERCCDALTEIVFSVLWLSELRYESFETRFAVLEEADAFHVGHSFAFLVVDSVG